MFGSKAEVPSHVAATPMVHGVPSVAMQEGLVRRVSKGCGHGYKFWIRSLLSMSTASLQVGNSNEGFTL